MTSGVSLLLDHPSRLWWPRNLFRWGDVPDDECPEQMDVTGQARVLAFGPFVELQAGDWRAVISYEVCDQAARRSYLVEFGSGADLSRARAGPVEPGRNQLCVEHHFVRPAAAEIRFWVARAAFHGELRFLGATLERGAPSADGGIEFASDI